ncbi:LSM domain-containing protein [Tieghemostelium lacteum]|uniref:U6 snRNA-associated Sm-like protein LSm4 n=1 Tax=Tieghemostelium lacteum TaxID=361077 RepID=A0A151ZAQ1_TIELA|nr:LSM domain-containing protein [Tieghemostelium lacteum]|eukprot:KYQ91023.1 LSM domain-containing protein [Tieghemostelium lacteum]
MLPLSLLRTGQGHQIMVELKNGETYNGVLVNCDNWMNINLKNVVRTSKDSDKFWKVETCYIRGNTIKYISVPDEIIDLVVEEEQTFKPYIPKTYDNSSSSKDSSPRGRGRGDSSRGRGDSSRGRGESTEYRGRGGTRTRGRGDSSRGRGESSEYRGRGRGRGTQ